MKKLLKLLGAICLITPMGISVISCSCNKGVPANDGRQQKDLSTLNNQLGTIPGKMNEKRLLRLFNRINRKNLEKPILAKEVSFSFKYDEAHSTKGEFEEYRGYEKTWYDSDDEEEKIIPAISDEYVEQVKISAKPWKNSKGKMVSNFRSEIICDVQWKEFEYTIVKNSLTGGELEIKNQEEWDAFEKNVDNEMWEEIEQKFKKSDENEYWYWYVDKERFKLINEYINQNQVNEIIQIGWFYDYQDDIVRTLKLSDSTRRPYRPSFFSYTKYYEPTFAISIVPNILPWQIESLELMFNHTSKFNQNISIWDTWNILDMRKMFYQATSFNQDISSWDVSNVERYEEFESHSKIASEPWKLPNFKRRID